MTRAFSIMNMMDNLQKQINDLTKKLEQLQTDNDYLAEKVMKLEKEVYHLTWKGVAQYE